MPQERTGDRQLRRFVGSWYEVIKLTEVFVGVCCCVLLDSSLRGIHIIEEEEMSVVGVSCGAAFIQIISG